MTTITEDNGRRGVAVTVELDVTPEQCWQAIATGAGISSWFLPTDVDERVGGEIRFHFAPGESSGGSVTAWEPPALFSYVEKGGWMPGAPDLATDCTIEPLPGGGCRLRIAHSMQADGAQWDDTFKGFAVGWASAFRVLRRYVREHPGERAASFRIGGGSKASRVETWRMLRAALALDNAGTNGRYTSAGAGAPLLAGTLEAATPDGIAEEAFVYVDTPARGYAVFTVHGWGGGTQVTLSVFLFGADAAAVAARDEPAWKAWIERTLAA